MPLGIRNASAAHQRPTLQTISHDRAAQLKADAIATRRASRAPWQNAHVDKLAREREAKEVSKAYRHAQREAQQQHKQCNQCSETKPVSAFELLPSGGLRNTCRDCRKEQKNAAKRAARAARRETPEYQAELARKEREKAERLAEREAAAASAKAEELEAKEAEWAALRAAELERRRKRLAYKQGVRKRPPSPEKQREAAERVPHLVALLMGTNPRQRISDQPTWEATASELQRLWLQSGDKQCVSCKAAVPPSRILPPGPANFYTGQCQSCATKACHNNHRRVTGREPEGPRLIPMKDGTTITVADLARRHREREQARRRR